MAPSMRKTIGAVKDQTSIGLAKVTSSMSTELKVAIIKATSHEDKPADEKYIRGILSMSSYSRSYVNACIAAVSRRLSKTRDWVVALKALMLVHRLMADGDPALLHEIMYATRRGTRLLNMADFRDGAHSNSWDHSAFVRTYALYLDQRLEFIVYERKQNGSVRPGLSPRNSWRSSPRNRYDRGDQADPHNYESQRRYSYSPPVSRRASYEERQEEEKEKAATPLKDMKPERVLGRMRQLQQLFDRFLACRPTGNARFCRLILIALYPAVRESFQLYADICEILSILLDRFFEMEYPDCVKSFEAYASAAKQIDELCAFYAWCKDTGVARSTEYPEVQRVTNKVLETLEEFMRDKAGKPKSPRMEAPPAISQDKETVEEGIDSIKALPAPSDYKEEQPETEKTPVEPAKPPQQQLEGDLLDLSDDAVTAEDHSNSLALALFQGPLAANGAHGSWEAFPSSNGDTAVTSAWDTPAADPGNADWELALVETASNLSRQKAALGGGFNPLLLDGMYDQGVVSQYGNALVNGGSASSVALPGPGKSTTPVLALPAPDGTVKAVGQDPFAASLSVPPPSYVQMADVEQKQQLLVQEQFMWQQYANEGMQGMASLSKLQAVYIPNPAMPHSYGMPTTYSTAGGFYHRAY